MTINELLDQLLPPKARLVVYLIVAVLSLGFTTWQASGGNWAETVFGVLVALNSGLAAKNTPIAPKEYETW